MSKISLAPNISGSAVYTIASPAGSTDRTLTLPDGSGALYNQSNIVGTVSQSGGVPTGAIIERGSNANGEFVKYADGTMICTIIGVTAPLITSSRVAYTWTFPASFSSTGYSASMMAGGGVTKAATQWVDDIDVASARYSFITPAAYVSGETAVNCRLTAIGRWY